MLKRELLAELKRFTTPVNDNFKKVIYAGEYLLATNGIMLAWATACSIKGIEPAKGSFKKDILKVISDSDQFNFQRYDVPYIATTKCKVCSGKGFRRMDICKECHGEGNVNLSNKYNSYHPVCKSCKGDGEMETKSVLIQATPCRKCKVGRNMVEAKYISIDGVSLDPRLLNMIKDYPDLQASYRSNHSKKALDRVYFKSSNGINVAIMAVKIHTNV